MLTVDESLIIEFLLDRQARGCQETTLDFYRWHLDILPKELNASNLRSYLVEMSQHRNSGGVHAAYRAIRAFCHWCEAEYDVDTGISKVSAPIVHRSEVKSIPLDAVKKLLVTCGRDFYGVRDAAMIVGLLETGCRVSEFVSLDLGDVDIKTGQVVVRHGKGGKLRTTFLGIAGLRRLLKYLRKRVDGIPLWQSKDGIRLSRRGLVQVLKRRCSKAGIEYYSPHTFRRAFTLELLRGGADIISISRLLGHAGTSLVERYAIQSTEDLELVYRKVFR